MTISSAVQSQFFHDQQQLIRLPLNPVATKAGPATSTRRRSGTPWSIDEHDRFLEALERYPSGPWKVIASYVGTRTTRQTMTHAQKYREKIARHSRGGTLLARNAGNGSHSDEECVPSFALHGIEFTRTAAGATYAGAAAATPELPRRSKSESIVVDCSAPSSLDAERFDGCMDAAIGSLLDDYEPFNLLGADEMLSDVWWL